MLVIKLFLLETGLGRGYQQRTLGGVALDSPGTISGI
jgi:hypothetical protein